MPKISRRTAELGTENAFVVLAEVSELVRQGKDIVSFCIGQPDFPTPANIQDGGDQGDPRRQARVHAVGGHRRAARGRRPVHGRMRGLAIRPEDVVVGAGAKPFIAYAILATTDYGAGDEVIYPNPGFPIYESQIKAHGAVAGAACACARRATSRSTPPSSRRSSTRARGSSSSTRRTTRPAGSSPGREPRGHRARSSAATRRSGSTPTRSTRGSATTETFARSRRFPGMYERTIISDGASKTWAMTGWRLGFASNPTLAPEFTRWVTNTDSCASQISQWAAVEAINGPQAPRTRCARRSSSAAT